VFSNENCCWRTHKFFWRFGFFIFFSPLQSRTLLMPQKADRAADIHRENMKKKRREMENVSMDATSDLLDTDSNATFAMVSNSALMDHDGDDDVMTT
jgi:hypothetical protein